MGPNGQQQLGWPFRTLLGPFGTLTCHVCPFLVQRGSFFGWPKPRTVDLKVKKCEVYMKNNVPVWNKNVATINKRCQKNRSKFQLPLLAHESEAEILSRAKVAVSFGDKVTYSYFHSKENFLNFSQGPQKWLSLKKWTDGSVYVGNTTKSGRGGCGVSGLRSSSLCFSHSCGCGNAFFAVSVIEIDFCFRPTNLMIVARTGSVALSRSYIVTLRFLVSTPTARPVLQTCVPLVLGLTESDAFLDRVVGGDCQLHLRRKTFGELDALPVPCDSAVQAVAAVLLLVVVVSTETDLRACRQVEHWLQVHKVHAVWEIDTRPVVFPLGWTSVVSTRACGGKHMYMQNVLGHSIINLYTKPFCRDICESCSQWQGSWSIRSLVNTMDLRWTPSHFWTRRPLDFLRILLFVHWKWWRRETRSHFWTSRPLAFLWILLSLFVDSSILLFVVIQVLDQSQYWSIRQWLKVFLLAFLY